MPKILAYARDNATKTSGLLDVIASKVDQGVRENDDVTFNSVDITTDLTVGGDLTVNGSITTINTNITTIQDNIILVNAGETATGVSSRYGGLGVDRNTLTEAQIVWDELSSFWRFGTSSNLKAITAREDSPLNKGIMIYNATNAQIQGTDTIEINISLSSPTNATSPFSGALTLEGGIGARRDIYTAGGFYVKGQLTNNYGSFLSDTTDNVLINSSNNIQLNPATGASIVIPANRNLQLGSTERFVSTGGNLSVQSGGSIITSFTGTFDIPDNRQIRFGTSATISGTSGVLSITPTTRANIPSSIPITFGSTTNAISADSLLNTTITAGNSIAITPTTSIELSSNKPINWGSSSLNYISTTSTFQITAPSISFQSNNVFLQKEQELYFGDTTESIVSDTSNNLRINTGGNLYVDSRVYYDTGVYIEGSGNNLTLSVPTTGQVILPNNNSSIELGTSTIKTETNNDFTVSSDGNIILTPLQNLVVNGNEFYLGTSASTSTSIALVRDTSNNLSVHSNQITIRNTTDSTNSSTGSMVLSGGLGVSKSAYFGNSIGVANNFTLSQTTMAYSGIFSLENSILFKALADPSTNYSLGRTARDLVVSISNTLTDYGSSGLDPRFVLQSLSGEMAYWSSLDGSFTQNGKMLVMQTDNSTNSATGSVVIAGGAGIAKNLYVGSALNVGGLSTLNQGLTVNGNVNINADTTLSLSITNGNLTMISTSGNISQTASAGINLNSGGNINLVATGGSISSTSATVAYTATGKISFDTTDTVNGIQLGTTNPGIPITIGNAVSNVVVVADNMTIEGNLAVRGTTTTIDSENLVIENNTIVVNAGPGAGTSDGGLLVERYQIANNLGTGSVLNDAPDYTGTAGAPATVDLVTVNLGTGAMVVDEAYNGWWIKITSGSGINQVRRIKQYVGATRIATIYATGEPKGLDFVSQPQAGDTYQLYSGTYAGMFYQESSDEIVFATVSEQTGSGLVVPRRYFDIHCRTIVAEEAFNLTGDTSVFGTLNVKKTAPKAFIVSRDSGIGNILEVNTTEPALSLINPTSTISSVSNMNFKFQNSSNTEFTGVYFTSILDSSTPGDETVSMNIDIMHQGAIAPMLSFTGYGIQAFPSFETVSNVSVGSFLEVNNTDVAVALNSSAGSIRVRGGAYVAKNLFVGTTLDVYSTSVSQSINTLGGITIAKFLETPGYTVDGGFSSSSVFGITPKITNVATSTRFNAPNNLGTVNNTVSIYSTNTDSLDIGYDSSNVYQIKGSSTKPLVIYTGTNTNQLRLNTDGTVSVANTLTASSTTLSTDSSTGSLVVSGDSALNGKLRVGTTNSFTLQTSTNEFLIQTGVPSTPSTFTLLGNTAQINILKLYAIYDSGFTNSQSVALTATTSAYSLASQKTGTGNFLPIQLSASGNTTQLVLSTSGGISSDGIVSLLNTSESTSVSSGALLLSGGLGVAKTITSALIQTPGTIKLQGVQDYTIESLDFNSRLIINGVSDNQFSLTSTPDDGSVSNTMSIFSRGGTVASPTSSERLVIGYDHTTSAYIVSQGISGLGQRRTLSLSASSNISQLVLNTDNSVSASGNVSITGTLSVLSTDASQSITTAGGLTVEKNLITQQSLLFDFNQPYNVAGNITGHLVFTSQTSGVGSFVDFYTNDNDGTDDNEITLYNTATSYLKTGFKVGTGNRIFSNDQLLTLYTSTNTTQLVLDTNGSVSTGGAMTVNSTVDATSATSGGAFTVKGGGAFAKSLWVGDTITSSSDERLKNVVEYIKDDPALLDKLQNIHGVKYKLKSDTQDKVSIGFLAQEFQEPFPELVATSTESGLLALNYDRITVLLLEAVKKLSAELNELKTKMN